MIGGMDELQKRVEKLEADNLTLSNIVKYMMLAMGVAPKIAALPPETETKP